LTPAALGLTPAPVISRDIAPIRPAEQPDPGRAARRAAPPVLRCCGAAVLRRRLWPKMFPHKVKRTATWDELEAHLASGKAYDGEPLKHMGAHYYLLDEGGLKIYSALAMFEKFLGQPAADPHDPGAYPCRGRDPQTYYPELWEAGAVFETASWAWEGRNWIKGPSYAVAEGGAYPWRISELPTAPPELVALNLKGHKAGRAPGLPSYQVPSYPVELWPGITATRGPREPIVAIDGHELANFPDAAPDFTILKGELHVWAASRRKLWGPGGTLEGKPAFFHGTVGAILAENRHWAGLGVKEQMVIFADLLVLGGCLELEPGTYYSAEHPEGVVGTPAPRPQRGRRPTLEEARAALNRTGAHQVRVGSDGGCVEICHLLNLGALGDGDLILDGAGGLYTYAGGVIPIPPSRGGLPELRMAELPAVHDAYGIADFLDLLKGGALKPGDAIADYSRDGRTPYLYVSEEWGTLISGLASGDAGNCCPWEALAASQGLDPLDPGSPAALDRARGALGYLETWMCGAAFEFEPGVWTSWAGPAQRPGRWGSLLPYGERPERPLEGYWTMGDDHDLDPFAGILQTGALEHGDIVHHARDEWGVVLVKEGWEIRDIRRSRMDHDLVQALVPPEAGDVLKWLAARYPDYLAVWELEVEVEPGKWTTLGTPSVWA
jgi:hypothetical protein